MNYRTKHVIEKYPFLQGLMDEYKVSYVCRIVILADHDLSSTNYRSRDADDPWRETYVLVDSDGHFVELPDQVSLYEYLHSKSQGFNIQCIVNVEAGSSRTTANLLLIPEGKSLQEWLTAISDAALKELEDDIRQANSEALSPDATPGLLHHLHV